MENSAYRSPHSVIDESAKISDRVSIWHFSQIRNNVSIGEDTSIGKSVYIDSQVKIGKGCKIQNNAQIYSPCSIANFVFIGPGVVLTNDKSPRATLPDGTIQSAKDWVAVGVVVNEGASIGANSICVAPITIGKWAMIGAGSVVTKDVPDYALVVGNPAKQVGWVGQSGKVLLELDNGHLKCPVTGSEFGLTKID